VINQRMEFMLRRQSEGTSLSELSRDFGISRTTAYKWITRFDNEGLKGLGDQSRRPKTTTKKLPYEMVTEIISFRQSHPSWGATTIRKTLLRTHRKVPSRRTIHRVLQECNFISTRRSHSRRRSPERTVVKPTHCNHVWTVDFKGWWRTNDERKVFPLTIRDEFSRCVLVIKMLPRPSLDLVKEAFIHCFQRFGLPDYIRSDNGTPFAFSQGLCGLSKLSAWWIKLGIIPNFIPLASPQFNGAHERLHKDIALDLESRPAANLKKQQLLADAWREEFNTIRPHSSLNDKTPSEVYKRSTKRYKLAEPPLEYPTKFHQRFVNRQGQLKYEGKRVFISKVIGGENVGLEVTSPHTINIWFATSLLLEWQTKTDTIREYDLITGAFSVINRAA
jgi:putative transposase